MDYDSNFGSMDFETLTVDENGLQQCYAGG
jgi:hypothetical protein